MQRFLVLICLTCVLAVAALYATGCSWRRQEDRPPVPSPSPNATAAAAVAAATPTGKQAPGQMMPTMPTGVSQLPAATLYDLSTEEQLATTVAPTRDLRDLALRFVPELDTIPEVVNATQPDFEVGDSHDFWVHDLDTNSNFEISAKLIHKTDVAYVWMEEDRAFDAGAILRSVERFSSQSYPAEVARFGSEWNPGVDNDPRVHILHAFGLGGGIAGYYSSTDQYSRLARPFSNEKEMFYINLQWLNQTNNYEYYETVLAHEFQHMVHWHQDRNEETWVNEGLSEYAQEVVGYDPDTIFAQTFATQPQTQLNTWGETQSDNSVHYGSAYLFIAYFAQRFGTSAINALVAHPANGLGGFSGALEAIGQPDIDVDDVFADWVIANYVDTPDALGLEGVYGYHNLQLSRPVLAKTYDAYPATTYQSSMPNYATNYLLFKGDENNPSAPTNITVDFSGQTTTQLATLDAYSGQRAWWSNRGDDLNSRLTGHFDLRDLKAGQSVTMTVAMWWDIEHAYDYGYFSASRDGIHWDLLYGLYATYEDPNGYAFGPGYTGRSTATVGAGTTEDTPEWVLEELDLSAYAGSQIWLRFDYVTDDAVNSRGWFIDDVQIPALAYAEDWEEESTDTASGDAVANNGWLSEGWLLTDNNLAQRWLLQVIHLENDRLQSVELMMADASGHARVALTGLTNDKTAVLAISALAPVTTEPAGYTLDIE